MFARVAVGLAVMGLALGCGGPAPPGPPGPTGPLEAEVRQEVPVRTLIAEPTLKPVRLTMDCELSSYYFFAYRDKRETHYSLRLRDPEGGGGLYGYAPKDAEVGKKLFGLLKDGQAHRLKVTVRQADRTHPDMVDVLAVRD